MVRAMHTVRPGTRLGEATRRLASLVADYPTTFDAEPLDGMETLRRSERAFYSTPVRLEDEQLPSDYVATGYGDGDDAAQQVASPADWAVTDTEVTLYHDEDTLHHETWLHLEYAGPAPDMEGARDSVLCVGVLEYGVMAEEARDYLSNPEGEPITPDAARAWMTDEPRVEMVDVVVPDPAYPAQMRERVDDGSTAAAYLEDRLTGDVFFDDTPVTELRRYTGEAAPRLVAETGDGRTVFRPR